MDKKNWGNRYYRWNGIDASQEISLWEYGMVARRVKNEEDWQVIARVSENSWAYGWINEEELKEILVSGWAKDQFIQFLSFIGVSSIAEWNDMSFYMKIYDMISYFGVEEFLGVTDTRSDKEIEEFTGIKK